MIAGFYALKNIKKKGQKIKINATQNNFVLLKLGKQHHTGEKRMTGQTSKVSVPVWTFPGSWRLSARQGANYRGSFGIFLICPRLVEDSKTGIHQATMAKIKL